MWLTLRTATVEDRGKTSAYMAMVHIIVCTRVPACKSSALVTVGPTLDRKHGWIMSVRSKLSEDYPSCARFHWPPCLYRNSDPRSDNRFRHFRNDLYLGDDPISTTPTEEKAARERLRARKRIGELKKRRKAKERKQRLRQAGEKSLAESTPATPRVALNETVMSRLDLSCFMKARRKGFAKAPLLENAHPAKYARRKNVLPPYNRYLVAVYECTEGFVFEDSMADRLFCSDGAWLGALPRCVKAAEATLNNVKRCNQDRGGCEHMCEDTQTGVKCSCFDGFLVKGSSCIDIDECADGTAGCAGICHNDPGSFHCECHSGYQLGTDGKSCLGTQNIRGALRNNHQAPSMILGLRLESGNRNTENTRSALEQPPTAICVTVTEPELRVQNNRWR
ncbi:Signal peptide, CUB and EGF-like domain-containing protein 2 [Eufriesea mexicana]|uniref:Signal peptide, CUB and EGF-like domain-containing protein 2 n=1 Tax=Eufriesea mexicana TaxID=516756 RepID=A0A310SLN2_9HYME|nr:Signal peptide, CUB and EGF-like domain-containing protein 2 [Eufriesea mexicana]